MKTVLSILLFLSLPFTVLSESAVQVSIVGNNVVSSTGPTTITVQIPPGTDSNFVAFSDSLAVEIANGRGSATERSTHGRD